MTSDTSASQAGLPLSPAQALFLVAQGAEGVFNEIQTLGVRSHRLLKTSLPLTSVTNVRRSKTKQKKTLSRAVWRNVALLRECAMIMGNRGGVQVRAKAFRRTQSSSFCSYSIFFAQQQQQKKKSTPYGGKVTTRRVKVTRPT